MCTCWWLVFHGFVINVEEPIIEDGSGGAAMSAVQGILSFLLTFRASIAYNRFWQGATLLG